MNEKTENPYKGLSQEKFDEQLALFKETLEDKDIYTLFGLEKAPSKEEQDLNVKNSEIVDLLNKSLNGDKTDKPLDDNPRMTTLEKTKFSEQSVDILSIDADFPVDLIQNLEVPWSAKVTIMSAMKNVANRNVQAIEKIKTEFGAKSTNPDVKLDTPEGGMDNKSAISGKDIVSKFAAKSGLKLEETA